jgi:hypothetical protein
MRKIFPKSLNFPLEAKLRLIYKQSISQICMYN